jgi:hypothetical protein
MFSHFNWVACFPVRGLNGNQRVFDQLFTDLQRLRTNPCITVAGPKRGLLRFEGLANGEQRL